MVIQEENGIKTYLNVVYEYGYTYNYDCLCFVYKAVTMELKCI